MSMSRSAPSTERTIPATPPTFAMAAMNLSCALVVRVPFSFTSIAMKRPSTIPMMSDEPSQSPA